MYWQYQTILFEFQKDGLLGDKYIDDEEVENVLNEQGKSGWELVSVSPVEEGLLAFLKKEIKPVAKPVSVKPAAVQAADSGNQSETRRASDHVHVKDQELIRRPDKKRKMNITRGDDDLIGGIKIS